MASHTAIGIDDNFPPRKATVALRAADNETPRWIDVVNGLLVKILCRNDRFDDAIDDRLSQFVVFNIRTMLRGDNDALNLQGLAVTVLNGHLRLAVGPKEISFAAFANLRQIFNQAMRHLNRKGHEFGSFIARITEHHSLIARALLLMQTF